MSVTRVRGGDRTLISGEVSGMSQVEQQVRKAQRRLNRNALAEWAITGVCIGLIAWLLVLVAQRLFAIGDERLVLISGAAFAAAITLAVLGVGLARHWTRLPQAALALDEAASLRERLSTALVCRSSSDPFAQAAHHDAERTATGMNVAAVIPFRRPRYLPASGVLAVVAAGAWFFVPSMDLLAAEEPQRELTSEQQQEKERITERLNQELKQLEQLKQQNPELAELDVALDPLDFPNEPGKTPDDVRRDAVRKLSNVTEQLKDKRNKLAEAGMLDELKRKLANLDQLDGDDLAAKFSKAMAAGDLKAAQEQLEQIKKKLEQAEQSDDPEQRKLAQQLKERLNKVGEKMGQLAQNNQRMQKELENKAGMSSEEAKKLLEKIAKQGMNQQQIQQALQQQLGQKLSQQQMQQMAKKLAQNQQAQQAMKQLAQKICQACQGGQPGQQGGQAGQAGQALQAAGGQLSELEMAEQMMQQLEMKIAQLQRAQGQIGQPGQPQQKPGNATRDLGNMGRGFGPNSEQRVAHQMKPEVVRGQLSAGRIIGQMLVDTPPGDEEATAQSREAVGSAVRDAQDAIEREQVPRQYHESMQRYFERLAGLQSGADNASE